MWRWADDQGEQRLVGEDELRSAIASGVLPPSTLVWREGMTAWMPAMSVAEFANVVPTGGGNRASEKAPEAANAPDVAANAMAAAATAPGPAASGAGPMLTASTLHGLSPSDVLAAAAASAKEKRTPSVAPPRPAAGSAKPAGTKTLRPNFGPAIPAPPRVPSEGATKQPAAPRQAGPIRSPAAAPPPRAPSTTAIDKEWSISDDETTNVPGKDKSVQRPEPPVETAAREAPSPRGATPQMQPSRASAVRTAPPPSPHAERRPTEETTESTTFQFEKNALSLRVVKPSGDKGEGTVEARGEKARSGAGTTLRSEAPPGLMESYAQQPAARYEGAQEGSPATEPSPDFGTTTQELDPAYARAMLQSADLPEPPKVREQAPTAMLPDVDDAAADDADKRPHEVSRTIRLAADFLGKVLGPALMQKPAASELLQIKPPPLPPPASALPDGQFVRLPSATPQAATSLALRAVQPPAPADPVPAQLPLNALLMSGGLLITMVIGAFFVGRCSVKPNAINAPTARAGIGDAVRVLQNGLPGPPKPCWVAKQPARYAPVVSKSIPFELLALASGKVAIGYAKSDDEAVGIEVTPATGQIDEDYVDKAASEITRVTPTGKGFFISTTEAPGSLKSLIPVSAEKPFYVGISQAHVALSDQPSGVATRLWPVGDDPSGLRTMTLGNRGFVVALRTGSSRQQKVFAGMVGADRKTATNLVHVAGSGGQVSEPVIGFNGRDVAIVFSEQDRGPWKVRMGRAPLGKVPETTTAFAVPAGGPGGDANYAAIAGLADGRWVLVWTEGSSGSKAVRAQTFGANFAVIGDPIVLSPPFANFGQGMVGVVGNHVAVVFVQRGRSNYELWGSVLQCG